MPTPTRQLAAIMPVRRSESKGGPARRSSDRDEGGPAYHSFSEGGFTNIVGYTALMRENQDRNNAPTQSTTWQVQTFEGSNRP